MRISEFADYHASWLRMCGSALALATRSDKYVNAFFLNVIVVVDAEQDDLDMRILLVKLRNEPQQDPPRQARRHPDLEPAMRQFAVGAESLRGLSELLKHLRTVTIK